jgi:outer membrane protein assembly factor BamA
MVAPMLLLLFTGQLYGQGVFQLRVPLRDQANFWTNLKDFKSKPINQQSTTAQFSFDSRNGLDTLCRALLYHFQEKSFLSISLDSLIVEGDSLATAQLWLGSPMRWISLRRADAESEKWLAAAGYQEKLFSNKPLQFERIIELKQQILEQAENNGYPFASVWLDSIEVGADGGVSAMLQVDRKRFFSFKGLKIIGDVRLPKYFLPNYLGLRTGMPYSRERVLRLRDQLQSLLFLETTSNPSVTFSASEAVVNVFLQKKRASRFDFIVGILPQPDNANGKLLLTGSLSAAFQNALNLGERFSIELERLRPETQKLDVQASVPYLFGTPFGVDGRLGIFRRDSTWVDAQGDVGVQYLFPGGNYLRFLWENKSATLQKIDTSALLASHRLPPNLDLKQNGFGLETSFTRLDYRFNPRKGWTIVLKSVAGFNKVQRNSQIENLRDPEDPAFRFSSLYDSVDQRTTRFRLEGQGALFIPMFIRSTLKIGLRAGGIFSNNAVFANEQYRLGGNKLLRGFDEESLQATRFVVATAEWRLLIGQNSFLGVFTDWGYLENITDQNRLFLRPLGFGAGLNFETRAGIFGINVAVGRRDTGQSINFRAAKFHLGYVSLF